MKETIEAGARARGISVEAFRREAAEFARMRASKGGPIKPREGLGSLRQLREAKRLRTDLVAIAEAAVKEDGSGAIKIIEPGWGSSGYYPAEVLERDGPTVFAAGTKMFWDHPTLSEEWERPERSLRDLAGELTSAATWNAAGQAGPGLYARVKVFEPFAPVVNELAPSIGVSIRAYGKATQGEAEGQTGLIIDELVSAESIDFVTFPGAGGQVLQIFEAARQRLGNPAHKMGAPGGSGKEDLTPQLEAEFRRGGLSAEAARLAASRGRARPAPGSLYEAALADGMPPAAAKVFARGRHGLNEVVKNVAGLPASAFAWVPDPEDPTTWRLQISRNADPANDWKPDEDLVRAAVAQVPGIAGYDQALDIPAADLPGVKSILRSAWIACGANLDEMPSELNQEALAAAFRRGGLSSEKAAIAARGREGRR